MEERGKKKQKNPKRRVLKVRKKSELCFQVFERKLPLLWCIKWLWKT